MQRYTKGNIKNLIAYTGNYVPDFTVTFDVGEHGTADGETVVTVPKYTEIEAPEVTANDGYIFKGWDAEIVTRFLPENLPES